MTDASSGAAAGEWHPGGPAADEYRTLLRWAYEGEIFGAVLVEDLLAREAFPAHVTALRLLALLESRTRDALHPLVAASGIDVDEAALTREAVDLSIATARGSWSEFLAVTERIACDALPSFRRLLAAGPPGAEAVLRQALAHEQTLLAFAQMETAGRGGSAADCVQRHLAAYPPAF